MQQRIPVLVLALLTLASPFSEAATLPDRPNILFLLADDLGEETLGCYGGTSYSTPHLDRLARTGMRFTHCYSMPVCHPSRVTLLTGRYPFRQPSGWGSFPRSAQDQTLAHALKRAGYATAVAGKWQLALLKNQPNHCRLLGFDFSSVFGWHEGPRYHEPMIYENGTVRSDTEGRFGPDLYVEALIEFMRRNKGTPFWAFYSMALCHDVSDDFDEPVPFVPGKDRYLNYKEMVEAMDERVGRLIEALDRMKLRKKTLIIFTGDNGSPRQSIITANKKGKLIREPVVSMQNGKAVPGGKGRLTDGGTHVPLIANWKGAIAPGQVVHDLVDFSDFFATFVKLAGARTPLPIDGRSFAPRLAGEEGRGRQWAFAEHNERKWVRTRDWKLYDNGRFFIVGTDPGETKPLDSSSLSGPARQAFLQLREALARLQ